MNPEIHYAAVTFINCCRVGCETWRLSHKVTLSQEGRRPDCDNVNRV